MKTPLLPATDLASLRSVVLLDARSRDDYERGHLPGALRADLDGPLSSVADPGFDPRAGGRHPLPPLERWTRQLGAWGIGPDSDVVIYDDQAGANAAARAWWMLRAVGHERVAVLDGGLTAALAAGLSTTAEEPTPDSREPYPANRWILPMVAIEEVDRLRRDPEWRVLDVRARERFRGETEPIDPIAGHIPGAINLPYPENLADGRFRPASELRRLYEQLLGDVSPERLVVHCGSGVTACHTLLALEAAGLRGASLYVGSWSEWCRVHMTQ